MKIKYTLVLFTALLFAACQQNNTHSHHASHEQEAHQGTTTEKKGLTLNGDKKWEADDVTSKHVAALGAQLNDFDKTEKTSTEDYNALAGGLSSELNALVADCKMTGPDHDALHSWLEPVLHDVSELKSASTAKQAAESVKSLNDRVQLFHQYFN